MNRTPLEIARAMRELLDDPSRWTKGANARNADGMEVAPYDPDAICWCLAGALGKHTQQANLSFSAEIVRKVVVRTMQSRVDLATAPHEMNYAHWQDKPDRTHAEVIGLLDGVIQDLEREANL